MIRVIIAGSRNFTDYDYLKLKCDNILQDLKKEDVIIVSGHARGADTLGEKYSFERGYKLEIYPADWNKYGKSAGYRRNCDMASVSNCLIAFKLKSSLNKGTNHMINIAVNKGLDIRVLEYEG